MATRPTMKLSSNSIVSVRSDKQEGLAAEQHLLTDCRASHSKRWMTYWLLEVFAAVLSILCLAALVALLVAVDGRPYEKWRVANVNITPNALISILSAFSKSSVLLVLSEGTGQLKWIYFHQRPQRLFDLQIFDEASRGPLGALRLIYTVKLRAIIAGLGAVLTILAVAIDPFAQQILSFPTAIQTLADPQAAIAVSRHVGGTGQTWSTSREGTWTAAELAYMDGISGAITTGMVGHFAPANYSCPSGVCSWPEFRTVGLCNRCDDISDRVETSAITEDRAGFKYVTYTIPHRAGKRGFRLQTQFINDHQDAIITASSLAIKSLQVFARNESDLRDSLYAVQTMRVNFTYPWDRSTWASLNESIRPEALQCSISLCEQTHAGTALSVGKLHDPLTSKRTLIAPGLMRQPELWSTPVLIPLWPADEMAQAYRPAHTTVATMGNHTYWAGSTDLSFIATNLGIMLANAEAYYTGQMSRVSLGRNSDYIVPMLDDITTSLTNWIRTVNSTAMVQGSMRAPATFVEVNWVWLVFPIAVVGFSVAYLLTVMLFSTGGKGFLWKTSLLPFLFYDFKNVRHTPTDLGRRDLKHVAQESFAVLERPEGHDWAFHYTGEDYGGYEGR